PKPRFWSGSPMLLALPLVRFGRMTSKPTFSYMLRRCGILKSWLSCSSEPLNRLLVVPVGSAWHWLHVNWPPSSALLVNNVLPVVGLPVAVAPPPLWFGTVIVAGIVSSRLRNGLG